MGGNVAWTIRLSDGTEYRMDRWTNILPGIMFKDAFLNEEKAALDEALEQWIGMKADWDANQTTKNWKFPMTPAYAPYPYGTRPSEYGFIVTDFQTKTIISCQAYTEPTQRRIQIEMHSKYNDLDGVQEQRKKDPEWAITQDRIIKEQMGDLPQLAKAGRITHYQDAKTWEKVPIHSTDLDEILEVALSDEKTFGRSTVFISPPDGWTLHDFMGDSCEDRQAAFDLLVKTGITLSDEEIADFQTWIKEPNEED